MSKMIDVMKARHSVRQFTEERIPEDIREALDAYAKELNRQSRLHIQILYDEPDCFGVRLAKYGRFANCRNYIALVGKKAADLDERCGFFGELLVLKAQEMGLNTCWAALTHGKSKAKVAEGEKEVIVIALGYGKTQGADRKSKKATEISNITTDAPLWFKRGIRAAMLAPTALNQQKFFFTRNGNRVTAKAAKIGTCLKIDLGIVKCHFELGAGKENFEWA